MPQPSRSFRVIENPVITFIEILTPCNRESYKYLPTLKFVIWAWNLI